MSTPVNPAGAVATVSRAPDAVRPIVALRVAPATRVARKPRGHGEPLGRDRAASALYVAMFVSIFLALTAVAVTWRLA